MPDPKPNQKYAQFQGKIGITYEQSVPHWEKPLRPRAGSPNIVIVYMDDLGWADLGCFGSEIDTPNIDGLAGRGLRFSHYTTPPICSSARAALLTGRNAHSVATGWLANNMGGFPGYSGELPMETPTIAETLKAAGYATIMVGKWHNSPNSVLPNKTWPTYRGFDRFYGFLEGETSYFHPARILMNNIVAPIDDYPEDYYATDDWMDKAIQFIGDIRNQDPTLPFFLYVSNNAVHGPLQAREADLAKYRGRFDAGWDVLREERLSRQKRLGIVPQDTTLAARDPQVPAWDSLPEAEKRIFCRYQEAYAAVLDCADRNVGRLVAQLETMGELDNTIIVFSSDNGGTGSAGPDGMVNFNRRYAGLEPLPLEEEIAQAERIGTQRATALHPMGWGQVANTPFPSYKTYTGAGGRRVAFIVSWPEKLTDHGAIRTQFVHATDILPTVAELAGVELLQFSHGKPAEKPHGKSIASALFDGAGASPRTEQYFECWSNRAFYRDGWIAVSLQVKGRKIDFDNWTLHYIPEDFSESRDLSAEFPGKRTELIDAFEAAAWENLVFPLDNRSTAQKHDTLPDHQRPAPSGTHRFLPGTQTIHRKVVTPLVSDRNFSATVRLDHNEGDQGVLFAIGDSSGGLVAFVEAGNACLTYNGFGAYARLVGPPVRSGAQTVELQIEALGNRRGRGRLLAGDIVGGWTDLSPTLSYGFHEGLDIGLDRRGPVCWDLRQRYGVFRYTGRIVDLVILSGDFAPDSRHRQP